MKIPAIFKKMHKGRYLVQRNINIAGYRKHRDISAGFNLARYLNQRQSAELNIICLAGRASDYSLHPSVPEQSDLYAHGRRFPS
jgi:hypothetical protein